MPAGIPRHQRTRYPFARSTCRHFGSQVLLGGLITIAALSGGGCQRTSTAEDSSVQPAIESLLRTQERAWNEGNIDAFVEPYWNSESLTFSTGGKTNRGYDATLNRYRERYPTPERMGRLTMRNLEITPLSDSAALVLGEWHLDREGDPVGGNFSLVLRKLDGRWRIIHDHTSQIATSQIAK